MKKVYIVVLFLLFIAIFLLLKAGVTSPRIENSGGRLTAYDLPDLDEREIKIAVENVYLPFNYILKETGEAGGWDYAVWSEICQRLNCQIKLVETTWDDMLGAIDRGEVDVIANGLTITPKRAKVLTFSDAYLNVQVRLMVRKDDGRFNNLEDVESLTSSKTSDSDETLKIGTICATNNSEIAKEKVGLEHVITKNSLESVVEALVNREIDAILMSEFAGQNYHGIYADKVKFIGPPVATKQLGFGFHHDSDLVEPVNQALSAMTDDKKLNTLTKNYFSEVFTVTANDITAGVYQFVGELPDLKEREIKVVIRKDAKPYSYLNPNTGEAEGWDYDVWREICGRLNCTPEFVQVELKIKEILGEIATNKYDVAATGITITEERAETVDFSDSYLNVRQRLLVPVSTEFDSVEAMVEDKNMIVGASAGSTNYDTAVRTFNTAGRVKPYSDTDVAIEAMVKDEIKGVVLDETRAYGYVGNYASDIQLMGRSLQDDQLGFAYPLGSDLVGPVNMALKDMRRDRMLDCLAQRYFSLDFPLLLDKENRPIPDTAALEKR
jgi:polar amino acid transport system substrate-binding protein